MGKKPHKTNAMRLLENAGVAYTTATYAVDENDLSGMHVAAELGQDPETLFKTLVLQADDGSHVVCCIPTNNELDLKKVARVSGHKNVQMIPMKALQSTTGYIRGGCSPLGMKKEFPTYIDETAVLFDAIAISAGVRGLQIIVNGETLATVARATFADLMKDH